MILYVMGAVAAMAIELMVEALISEPYNDDDDERQREERIGLSCEKAVSQWSQDLVKIRSEGLVIRVKVEDLRSALAAFEEQKE